jgi:hypothetical protein
MPRIQSAEIDIAAPAKAVWDALVDTAKWPAFDPYCDRIEGVPALGATIKAFTKLAPGRAFPVKVTTFEAPRLMVWSGGMPLGLFTGVRTFTVTAKPSGLAHFAMTEVFSGPLLGLIGKSLPDMTEPFDAFCKGLKATAEAKS